jgi:hypothetical protein
VPAPARVGSSAPGPAIAQPSRFARVALGPVLWIPPRAPSAVHATGSTPASETPHHAPEPPRPRWVRARTLQRLPAAHDTGHAARPGKAARPRSPVRAPRTPSGPQGAPTAGRAPAPRPGSTTAQPALPPPPQQCTPEGSPAPIRCAPVGGEAAGLRREVWAGVGTGRRPQLLDELEQALLVSHVVHAELLIVLRGDPTGVGACLTSRPAGRQAAAVLGFMRANRCGRGEARRSDRRAAPSRGRAAAACLDEQGPEPRKAEVFKVRCQVAQPCHLQYCGHGHCCTARFQGVSGRQTSGDRDQGRPGCSNSSRWQRVGALPARVQGRLFGTSATARNVLWGSREAWRCGQQTGSSSLGLGHAAAVLLRRPSRRRGYRAIASLGAILRPDPQPVRSGGATRSQQ